MERGLGSQTLSRNQNDVIKILKGWVRRVGERIKSYKNENKKNQLWKSFDDFGDLSCILYCLYGLFTVELEMFDDGLVDLKRIL